jgi:hypothetical protein
MRSESRRFLIGFVFAVLAGVAWLTLLQSRGPVYEGRPLNYWLRHPTRTPVTNSPFLGLVAITFPKVDSNAVPFLTKALEQADGPIDQLYRTIWSKLSPRLRNRLPMPVFPGEVRAHAADILTYMGTNAQSAIPALIRVMKSEASEGARFSAATCLLAVGAGDPRVWAAFREALDDKSEGVRYLAGCYLRPTEVERLGLSDTDFSSLFLGVPLFPDGITTTNQ